MKFAILGILLRLIRWIVNDLFCFFFYSRILRCKIKIFWKQKKKEIEEVLAHDASLEPSKLDIKKKHLSESVVDN
jgi:hypothetical protein